MTAELTDSQTKRLATFSITNDDLARLRGNREFAERRLPALLNEWHRHFDAWPEIQAALKLPDVHAARLDHWTRAASGRIDAEFAESAKRLATLFYRNGVPAYAVSICHYVVSSNIARELGLTGGDDGLAANLFGAAARRTRAAQLETLNKIAWFDIELLLETYREAEEESKRATLDRLAGTFEDSVKGIVEGTVAASNQMQAHAQRMSEIATSTSRRSSDVASETEVTSSSMQTVAAATEQLSISIADISRHVTESSRISSSAVDEAERTKSTVSGLVEEAKRIGDVVKLISNIASQTNLLALNATIEAARAGEAGKGFAVVANEVKHLANQTAKATEDISSQIAGMQSAAGNAAEAIHAVGRTITHINEIVTTVAATVEQQTAATQEITRNVQEVAVGTRRVTDSIGQVTQSSSETGGIAREVLAAAGLLHRQADDLNRGVGDFLTRIRTAR
ncbi:globin-coupled sensor protein (plasmid) [Azospirillum oryzae]|uniref:Globin-coupled sensor protein n=1 Tax=Azospirillum oryzae TaxID=286727 RepID=A0A6N1ACN1_9PROT|nr:MULTISPECIES: globin-coupled sensor protein [Azospirillum]KAA0576373.1 chemotaxis protein [Azospirillum sp. Sh1]KAA0585812.1 chemotaxis protein [Azospirillum oryzae]QKS49445.1 globin-coupled sensor protein [Azospirillum oryzae]GLR80701.1 chemotaxis protein [Azospirillum oryzae]